MTARSVTAGICLMVAVLLVQPALPDGPVAAAQSRPRRPVIIEPGAAGQIVHPADVHMATAPYFDADGHAHYCTTWVIMVARTRRVVWRDRCDKVNKVHVHLGDGAFVGPYAGRTQLKYGKEYILRVRFRQETHGRRNWSRWRGRRFVTSPAPPPGTTTTWTAADGFQVDVFAGGLQLPVNIAFLPTSPALPSDPLMYVTELHGAIKVVAADGTVSDYFNGALNYAPPLSFPGSGEQGLTGIVVEPTTGDVFASMLYEGADGQTYPRVVRFDTAHGGAVAEGSSVVIDMPNTPMGASHQISNLSIGPDGMLYVHMGDGFATSSARDRDDFRGKILRMNLDGSPAPLNPFYDAGDGITAQDFVFALGFRNPFGGAWRSADGELYEVENGPSVDRLAKVVRGVDYMWDGTNESMHQHAAYVWNPGTAPVNIAFVEPQKFDGSGFPGSKLGHAFVTESGPTYGQGRTGKRISEFELDAAGNVVGGRSIQLEYTGTGRATAAALAAGPDGLYFSDLYKDHDASGPTDRGAQILRVRWVGN